MHPEFSFVKERSHPLVPCSFSIARCSTRSWVLLTPCAPIAPSDCSPGAGVLALLLLALGQIEGPRGLAVAQIALGADYFRTAFGVADLVYLLLKRKNWPEGRLTKSNSIHLHFSGWRSKT